MYNFIKGKIFSKENGLLILENNGIGYEINVSNNAIDKLPMEGEEVKVLTYLQVREDEMSLYGFYSKAEKDMFLNLITVNGIGPKMAIGILSNVGLSDLQMAIVNQDTKILSKIKGIGAKTAERIILELKEKISTTEDIEFVENKNANKEIQDAIFALESLGMQRIDAVKSVRQVAENTDKAEDIIAKVLKKQI